MASSTQLPVVTEERVGVDVEEGAASVYCRRCGGLVSLDTCAACAELLSVDSAGGGGLAVDCAHRGGGLDSQQEPELRDLLDRVALGDVRAPWFVTTHPWASLEDLATHAPQGTRWVVVVDVDGHVEGVVDLSHRAPRGATAADAMTRAPVQLVVEARLLDALEALSRGPGPVVVVDDRSRAAGIFDLPTYVAWLRGRAPAQRDQTLPDGHYVFVGGRIEVAG